MTGDYSVTKVVEDSIRRITLTYEGQILDKSDLDQVRMSLVLMYTLLGDFLPDSTSSQRLFRGFLGSSEISVKKMAETLDFLDKYLKRYLQDPDKDERIWNVPSFKRSVRQAGLYYGLIKPIETSLLAFLENNDVGAFRVLNIWANFPLRMNLRSLDLTFENTNKYIQDEIAMRKWVYDKTEVAELREIITEWFKDFNYDLFAPAHGPGAVSEILGTPSKLEKYRNFRSDKRLEYFYTHVLNSSLEFYTPWISDQKLDRTSKLILVPKSMLKNRSISKEPVSLQFTQQGISYAVVNYIDNHPILHRIIQLSNQDRSRGLARYGSIIGEFATIDLSNASDSITWSLVKSVFRNTPLYSGLVCSRSDYTQLPNGITIELEKFAPMGSCLCFPVECIIFSAICELACRKIGRKRKYIVYGDDIICHHTISQEVIRLLACFNFSVNMGKSFFDSMITNFRESCGGEYLDNQDVTPFRISRWWKSYSSKNGKIISSADNLASYISFINKAYDAGYFDTRRYLLSTLAKRFPNYSFLMFGKDDSKIKTFDDSLTNWKLKSRFMINKPGSQPCYQRKEVYAIVMQNVRINTPNYHTLDALFEEVRLNEWFLQSLRRSTERLSDEKVDIRPTVTKLSWKWVYSME